MTRTRGIMVRTLDLSDLTGADAPVYGYALATASDGRTYAICTEGVGWEVTDDAALVVDTRGGCYALTLSDVIRRAVNGTGVDLSEFVRTFGARLESNFHMWARRLSAGAER